MGDNRPCVDPTHCHSTSTTSEEPGLPPDQVVDCSQLGPGIFQDHSNCRSVHFCTDFDS